MMEEIEARKKNRNEVRTWGKKNLGGFNLKRTWMGEPPGNSGSINR